MTTIILLSCSILVAFTLACLFRRRLARCIPQTVNATILITSLVVLAVLGLALDVVCLVSLVATIGQHRLLGIVLAATVVSIGCSKPADAPKPQSVHWSAAEAGYHSESVVPDNKGTRKKEP